VNQYPCSNCGANVEYAPGTTVLKCPYCGAETPLVPTGAVVRERSFAEFARLPRKPVTAIAPYTFTCRGCGAVTQSDKISDRCQFCGAPLVADTANSEMVSPEAVLPFDLDRAAVREQLRKWASSRWFAPSGLKKVTEAESSHSTYLPHWTYDARTQSYYTGQRGEHYYVTETYTENGETRTRQVQRTRWYSVDGTVARDFDDLLVIGTGRIAPKYLDKLEPWPLLKSEPFRPEFLAGHETLRYDVEPEAGLETAKSAMESQIQGDVRDDIGGDEQRVDGVQTSYADVTFKLMLLPVWIACYLHAGKTYNVLVNGRTGEVAGERPYSPLKITLAVILAIVVIGAIIAAFAYAHRH
jgi:Zn finger protein HypA/HybF involved in hydrogenase expression